ncbi:MAG: Uncharacterised protein [Alphaproteobacteria bacterium]|nr:MAG: Uncharacterised protein [Alphaproteobacteria bacterium]
MKRKNICGKTNRQRGTCIKIICGGTSTARAAKNPLNLKTSLNKGRKTPAPDYLRVLASSGTA